ncbi:MULTISPECIES: sigma 54-interacting transcriptional regulator [unclassified Ensifer]|uniref:sigma 54-interacting transcriptional regulator n=1 Tax=unclassified Ensifer TaxID=2633371 RepID=UPI000812E9E5|nr:MULTISPECIES: sigma 54-interacting transcriptional regulator [unclassified Ensifer]OCP22479.1 hypothetical protein BC361_24850 [Ensifer sp. LC54]OCP22689.1 hypothetical protein BC363_26985 [Ensifer sp. LC384]
MFELASGGVLSLDEIGEMPLDMQPFLLRVLEERAVNRLGDSRLRPVDVRLVASTNRDLKVEVANGRFRKDLFYRISTVSICVPPLRDRGTDSLLLIEHFNRKMADRRGSPPLRFSNQALDALLAYSWPGNVRELRNLVERLQLLSNTGNVGLEDLPVDITEPAKPAAIPEDERVVVEAQAFSLEDAERQAICSALRAEYGNLSKTAQRLGVSRPTLYRKLDQFGIKRRFL